MGRLAALICFEDGAVIGLSGTERLGTLCLCIDSAVDGLYEDGGGSETPVPAGINIGLPICSGRSRKNGEDINGCSPRGKVAESCLVRFMLTPLR